MLVRAKPTKGFLRPRRAVNGGDDKRAGGHGAPTRAATGEVARSRRQGGQSQDRALYTCSCGFAFDALVSTSVGCPHCGSTQAW